MLGGHFWPAGDPMASQTEPWFVKLVTPDSLYGHDVGAFVAPHPTTPEAISHHHEIEHAAHVRAVYTSFTVVGIGLFMALLLYVFRRDWPAVVAGKLGLVYEAVRDKYYVDELADATAIRATMAASRFLTWFDANVVDGVVNLVGRTGRLAGSFSAWVDRTFVDGAVNGVALLAQTFGSVIRLVQTGRIQQYATFAVGGGLAVAAWLILM
jgi:NADH-quinone oxidoreductase subunit L